MADMATNSQVELHELPTAVASVRILYERRFYDVIKTILASLVIATRFHKTFTNFPPHFIHIERGVSQVLSRGVPLIRSSRGENRR